MITITTINHSKSPKGATLKSDKLIADMDSTELAQMETAAAAKEAEYALGSVAGLSVWTVDESDLGIPPRGSRSES